ncbi:P2X purinoceptor 7-like [Hydractinia symbiolongicarpus]|uniref:P2X purinoceptor 7-like n=1 Tax=Hydractinia symbiolongicarpus TaxID=13093 RepID=UPI00254AAD5B|nr:P2X purinoceptor 7-like [Hydractinia symbiolongicarpus]
MSCNNDEEYNLESSESDNSLHEKDFTKLQPYEFELLVSDEEEVSNGVENDEVSFTDAEPRTGNANWCECGNCRAMETDTESVCCVESNEIPDEFFQGHKCVTEAADFQVVVLTKAVLETALSALHDLRGDTLELKNESYRYAGYKQFTWWIHSRLGKGVRRVIPSCVVWAIRRKYPAEDEKYVLFKES